MYQIINLLNKITIYNIKHLIKDIKITIKNIK